MPFSSQEDADTAARGRGDIISSYPKIIMDNESIYFVRRDLLLGG
jgi:hypothetical protein